MSPGKDLPVLKLRLARASAVLVALLLSATSLVTVSPPAAAVPTDTCGGSVDVSPDVAVRSFSTDPPVGVVQLRRDSSYFYSPVPSGYWGMARLFRFLDGNDAGTPPL
jgi:hypothetical protein